MKIYRVINDCECVLTTANELDALRMYHKCMQKHETVGDFGWIDIEEV